MHPEGFIVLRHLQFLRNLEQLRFTGRLLLTTCNGQTWTLYLIQGRIVYAMGGAHPVRRWQRHIKQFCPQIPASHFTWEWNLAHLDTAMLAINWEYALLHFWLQQKTISREQAIQVISATIAEVLFDSIQVGQINSQVNRELTCGTPWLAVGVDKAIATAVEEWQSWCHARLSAYSPNQAPVVRQPDRLRKAQTIQVHPTLLHLLNGHSTLRELSVELNRNVTDLTAALLPGLQSGWLELLAVNDWPVPNCEPMGDRLVQPSSAIADSTSALIACIDHNPTIHSTLEALLAPAGYRFIGLDDPLRAIGTLETRQPDFIFLNVAMPQMNGYEVCERLRRLNHLRRTPIVMLTDNGSALNWVNLNLVGASGFLSKPFSRDAVLSTIRKHLNALEVIPMQ